MNAKELQQVTQEEIQEIMREEIQEMLDEVNDIKSSEVELYRNKLVIDTFDLDTNCADQALYYSEMATIYSKIFILSKKMKVKVKEGRGKLALNIRQDPSEYGLAKVTDSSLISAIDSNFTIVKIEEMAIEGEGIRIDAEGVLNGYEHRRSMLNNEVQLVLSGLEKPIRDNKTEKYKVEIKNKKLGGTAIPPISSIKRKIKRT